MFSIRCSFALLGVVFDVMWSAEANITKRQWLGKFCTQKNAGLQGDVSQSTVCGLLVTAF